MRRHFPIFIAAILLSVGQISAQVTAPELNAEWVKILNNRGYFPAVEEIFGQAKNSIWVMMYSARYYTEPPQYARNYTHGKGQPYSNTNLLLEDLIEAAKRGIEVVVILDSSDWNKENTQKNRLFAHQLKRGGIKAFFDHPQVTTHNKLILVDDDLTIVGSTNWTYYALEENNETSVVIKSGEINKAYRKYFLKIKKKAQEF